MNTKTIIGAIIGIIIIVAIVIFARSGTKPAAPADVADTSGATAEPQAETPMPSQEAEQTPANPNKLGITIVKQGQGAGAVAGDTVTVNYTGKLTNGTVFDSNTDPKFGHVSPFPVTLGQNQVIQGWEQGLLGIKMGEKRHLVIPASLGYADHGVGTIIPPNATLEFDVEAISISHQ